MFGVFGDGQYRLQPIYVDDLAELAVKQGREGANTIIDAIGPETFTYRELVREIGTIIGKPRPIISLPPSLGYVSGWLIGKFTGDVVITREEIEGLMQNLLCTKFAACRGNRGLPPGREGTPQLWASITPANSPAAATGRRPPHSS